VILSIRAEVEGSLVMYMVIRMNCIQRGQILFLRSSKDYRMWDTGVKSDVIITTYGANLPPIYGKNTYW